MTKVGNRGEVERAFERRLHSRALGLRAPDGTAPSKATYKMWEHEHWPLRVLARRIEEWARARVPLSEIRSFLREVEMHAMERHMAYAGDRPVLSRRTTRHQNRESQR